MKRRVAIDVEPNYGMQKIRLGVKIKNGSYVPPAITTTGSVITIVESGPSVDDPSGTMTTTCTTKAGTTDVPGSTATFCKFRDEEMKRARGAGRKPASVHGPVPPEDDTFTTFVTQTYSIGAGDTVTLTQTGVNEGLIGDPAVEVIQPCVNDNEMGRRGDAAADAPPACPDRGSFDQYVFEDTGLPPVTQDDTVKTCAGVPIDVDVLKNDTPHAPVLALDVTSKPKNGLAQVRDAAGPSPFVVRYTPKDGFAGADSFTYNVGTANGSATGKANLVVIAPPTATDDSASTELGRSVAIDVTENDDANGGEPLALTAVSTPTHGGAAIDGDSVRYTPADDFEGTDTFTYTIRTGCGVATASVSVDITGGGGTGGEDRTNPPPLADTGSNPQELLQISLALLLAGAGATVVGGQRHRRRNAG